MNHLRIRLFAPLLGLLLAAQGCAGLVAGAGVGFLVSQQVLPNNVHVAQVRTDAAQAWPVVHETLSFFVDPGTEMELQDYPRVARAKIEGAKVTVEVEAYDEQVSLIRVYAERMFTADSELAARIMTKILERLAK